MILEFREDIGQSIEGLALLMQMDPEEYVRLEEDWIPPDETLQRLCALFEWNFNEIKRIADHTPSSGKNSKKSLKEELSSVENKSSDLVKNHLAKLIKDAREDANQDSLGIATLLGISVDYYNELEDGAIPNDELLRKLCLLFGWNYKQILQKVNSQNSIFYGTQQPLFLASEVKARMPKQETIDFPDIPPPLQLHEQILQARMNADQNVEGISLLLQINPELYEQIESGYVKPDPDLLKRISALFDWNYNELLNREKNSQYSQLLPAITSLDNSESSIEIIKLRQILDEISDYWHVLNEDQKKTIFSQIEFIRDSMENMSHDK